MHQCETTVRQLEENIVAVGSSSDRGEGRPIEHMAGWKLEGEFCSQIVSLIAGECPVVRKSLWIDHKCDSGGKARRDAVPVGPSLGR